MPSAEFTAFMAPFRTAQTFGPELTIDELRSRFEALAGKYFKSRPDVEYVRNIVANVPAAWIIPPGVDRGSVILYLHGGGYGIGSINTHEALVANIATAAGVQGLLIEYRLAPENPFPSALDDSLAAYQELLSSGVEPMRIVLAGDSAGGGLALSLLFAIRDRRMPMPAGVACLSPLTDLTHSGQSVRDRAHRDPFVTVGGSTAYADRYLGPAGNPRDPLASPIFGDFEGLPPVLVLVGSEEILFDDARIVAEKLAAAGNQGSFEIWDDMIHVWPMFYEQYPEARDGVNRVAKFVRHVLASGSAEGSR